MSFMLTMFLIVRNKSLLMIFSMILNAVLLVFSFITTIRIITISFSVKS